MVLEWEVQQGTVFPVATAVEGQCFPWGCDKPDRAWEGVPAVVVAEEGEGAAGENIRRHEPG